MLKKNILVQLVSFVNVYYLEYFAAGRCPFISTGTICHFQCFLFRAFLLSTTLSHFIHIHVITGFDAHYFQFFLVLSTCNTLTLSYKLKQWFQFSLLLNQVLIFFKFVQILIWAVPLWDSFSEFSDLILLFHNSFSILVATVTRRISATKRISIQVPFDVTVSVCWHCDDVATGRSRVCNCLLICGKPPKLATSLTVTW